MNLFFLLADALTQNIEVLMLQWKVKATYLTRVLMSVPEVKFTAVAGRYEIPLSVDRYVRVLLQKVTFSLLHIV